MPAATTDNRKPSHVRSIIVQTEQRYRPDPAAAGAGGEDIQEQARDLAGSGKIRLRIDETDVPTRYANSFRTNVTPEDVIIDFGMNTVTKANRSEKGIEAEILFKIDEKRVINYYTAKRLAITLSRLVRVYEERLAN